MKDESSLNAEEYLERNLSAESLDSDDLDGEMNLSDSDDAGKKRAEFKAKK